MYCPDTLERLNNKEVEKYAAAMAAQAKLLAEGKEDDAGITCDFCSSPAIEAIPIYNPSDSVRGVEGAYDIRHVCQECLDNGKYLEEAFYCDGCGELFITHHSWDNLVCQLPGGIYCHKCALEAIKPVPLRNVISDLQSGKVGHWVRINGDPDREQLWEGEFSQWPDFPGHTTTDSLVKSIKAACKGSRVTMATPVIPMVTATYQFAVALSIYIA